MLKTYSKELGIKSFFLSKSKTAKGQKNNFFVFSLLDITYQEGKNHALAKVLESKIRIPLMDIRFNIQKTAMALLLSEILGKCIREEEANLNLYDFLEQQILNLENSLNRFANFYLYFLCQLMQYLGFSPELSETNPYFDLKEGVFLNSPPNHIYFLNEQDSSYLFQFLKSNWEEAKEIKMNGTQRINFLHQILQYYKLHLGVFEIPKSLAIIEEVFHS